MIATQLDEATVNELCQRRAAGESLTVLADELGVPWQRVLVATHNRPVAPPARKRGRIPCPRPLRVRVPKNTTPGPLTKRYRPRTLDQIVGQPAAVAVLKQFAAEPYPAVLIFEGVTGTGKTSAALALADALGCDLEQQEFGGVHEIASGEQTAEAVRETYRRIWNTVLYGSGWKVAIVNEADRMNPAAETIWLDRLERLPPRTVIVFTTNYAAKLSKRFRDRCIRLEFDGDAANLEAAAVGLLMAIWRGETGKRGSVRWLRSIV